MIVICSCYVFFHEIENIFANFVTFQELKGLYIRGQIKNMKILLKEGSEKTMKQILHRSPLLMLIFAAVAMLFVLCFSTILEFYEMKTIAPDFLSGNHVLVEIESQKDDKNVVTTQDLLNFCENNGNCMMLYREFAWGHGKSVYLKGDVPFEPQIIEGRNFTKADFNQHTPTVLIEESLRNKCIEKNGKYYYVHENNDYEVIGIFKRPVSRAYASWKDSSSLYYVNMAATFGTNLNVPIVGNFIIDSGEESNETFDEFITFAKQINPDIVVQGRQEISTSMENLVESIADSAIILIEFGATALLVLLNIFSVTRYWLEGRKKEIAVRMLSGGRSHRIKSMILIDYLLILTIGYGLGLIFAILLIRTMVFPFIGETIHISAIVVGYMLCMLIGVICNWISLNVWLKQDIVMQLR